MKAWGAQRRLVSVVLGVLGLALLAPAGALGARLHPKLIAPKTSPGVVPAGFARAANGALHVAFETNVNWGNSANGIGTTSISLAGHVGPVVQALSWGSSGGSPSGIPGLGILPSGALEAVVGGSPGSDPGPWGVTSTDGGATWSAPTDVGSGSMEAGDGNVALAISNGTPVLAAGCCGGIVIQEGLGGGTTYLLTNNADGSAGNTDLAVDAATGAVVAGWDSNDGKGGLWWQQAAPSEGAALKTPVPSQYGTGRPPILAGRDIGPGVFTSYPANFGNTSRIRLLRYGGGSVPVGSVKGLFANAWGVATGPDGRIWVMWYGQINGKGIIAVTRSNMAANRFEPIQRYDYNWNSLATLQGDGRLGPLDMLVTGTGAAKGALGGIYWARVLPELSGGVSVKDLGGGKFKLRVVVTDAGDPVFNAAVGAKGVHKHTNVKGKATLIVTGSAGQTVTVGVNQTGYLPLTLRAVL